MSLAFHDAVLRGQGDVGGGLVRIVLEPPPEVVGSYARPGQYILLRAGGKETYFVLAGDAGDETWELILRPSGEVAQAVVDASPGACVEVSGAQGGGFPIEEAHGRELW